MNNIGLTRELFLQGCEIPFEEATSSSSSDNNVSFKDRYFVDLANDKLWISKIERRLDLTIGDQVCKDATISYIKEVLARLQGSEGWANVRYDVLQMKHNTNLINYLGKKVFSSLTITERDDLQGTFLATIVRHVMLSEGEGVNAIRERLLPRWTSENDEKECTRLSRFTRAIRIATTITSGNYPLFLTVGGLLEGDTEDECMIYRVGGGATPVTKTRRSIIESIRNTAPNVESTLSDDYLGTDAEWKTKIEMRIDSKIVSAAVTAAVLSGIDTLQNQQGDLKGLDIVEQTYTLTLRNIDPLTPYHATVVGGALYATCIRRFLLSEEEDTEKSKCQFMKDLENDPEERLRLSRFERAIQWMLKMDPAENRKGVLLEIGALLEGKDAFFYVSGKGATKKTKRRQLIIESLTSASTRKKRRKREFAEVDASPPSTKNDLFCWETLEEVDEETWKALLPAQEAEEFNNAVWEDLFS